MSPEKMAAMLPRRQFVKSPIIHWKRHNTYYVVLGIIWNETAYNDKNQHLHM